MGKVDFSVPIYVDGGSVLVRARSKLARLPDLNGKRIAVIAGTTTEEELARGARHERRARRCWCRSRTAAKGWRCSRAVGRRLRRRPHGARLCSSFVPPNPDAYRSSPTISRYEPFGLGVRRDDPDFRLAVNRALVELYRSGDIDRSSSAGSARSAFPVRCCTRCSISTRCRSEPMVRPSSRHLPIAVAASWHALRSRRQGDREEPGAPLRQLSGGRSSNRSGSRR